MRPVFLLGAGFTRAVIGDSAPLTHELMNKLDISKCPEIREDYERAFPDIEEFLSILDLKILHSRRNNNLPSNDLNHIRENIVQQIFKQVGINALHVNNFACYPLLKSFLDRVPTRSCILTLNYDCVLDQGLYHTGRWSPFGGYCYSTFPHTTNENDSRDRILLLKLHGSCNFRDVEEGQEYFNIEITDKRLRDQVETVLIQFLKKNAVINKNKTARD